MKALKEKRISLRSLLRMGLVILSVFAIAFAACGNNDNGSSIDTNPPLTKDEGPTPTDPPPVPTAPPKVATSVTVIKPPDLAINHEGQKPILDGMVVTVVYNDYSTETFIDDFDSFYTIPYYCDTTSYQTGNGDEPAFPAQLKPVVMELVHSSNPAIHAKFEIAFVRPVADVFWSGSLDKKRFYQDETIDPSGMRATVVYGNGYIDGKGEPVTEWSLRTPMWFTPGNRPTGAPSADNGWLDWRYPVDSETEFVILSNSGEGGWALNTPPIEYANYMGNAKGSITLADLAAWVDDLQDVEDNRSGLSKYGELQSKTIDINAEQRHIDYNWGIGRTNVGSDGFNSLSANGDIPNTIRLRFADKDYWETFVPFTNYYTIMHIEIKDGSFDASKMDDIFQYNTLYTYTTTGAGARTSGDVTERNWWLDQLFNKGGLKLDVYYGGLSGDTAVKTIGYEEFMRHTVSLRSGIVAFPELRADDVETANIRLGYFSSGGFKPATGGVGLFNPDSQVVYPNEVSIPLEVWTFGGDLRFDLKALTPQRPPLYFESRDLGTATPARPTVENIAQIIANYDLMAVYQRGTEEKVLNVTGFIAESEAGRTRWNTFAGINTDEEDLEADLTFTVPNPWNTDITLRGVYRLNFSEGTTAQLTSIRMAFQGLSADLEPAVLIKPLVR